MRVQGIPSALTMRAAGLLGSLGMLGGVVADLASGYSTTATTAIVTPFSVLSIPNLFPYLLSKPAWQVLAGHYLALVAIPMGLFGFWHVYRAILPAGGWIPRVTWLGGVWAFVVGTVLHSSFTFVIFAGQATHDHADARQVLNLFQSAFQPVGSLLILVMVGVLGCLFYLIVFQGTLYPRWFALLNPLFIQVFTGSIALFAPKSLRVLLIITSYNLSLFVLFAASTVVLWNPEAPRFSETDSRRR